MKIQGVAILGSTGSIGTTALKVLSRHTDRFRVAALTAFSNAQLLSRQADEFHPSFLGMVGDGAGGGGGGERAKRPSSRMARHATWPPDAGF